MRTQRRCEGRYHEQAADKTHNHRAAAAGPGASCSCIGSSRVNVIDFRASKAVNLGAGAKLEIIAQAFNLLNTTNLQAQYGGGRVTNSLSANFGAIQTAMPGTQGELAAKITW